MYNDLSKDAGMPVSDRLLVKVEPQRFLTFT